MPLRGPVVEVGQHVEELILLLGPLAALAALAALALAALAGLAPSLGLRLAQPLLVVEGDLVVDVLEPGARLASLRLERGRVRVRVRVRVRGAPLGLEVLEGDA